MELELLRNHQRTNISTAYRQKNELLRLSGRRVTYENQQEAASKIIEHFTNGKVAVVLVAQPGAGKTGAVVEVQYRLGTHNNDDMFVFADNFHTISGMSDCEWKKQTQSNMLDVQKLRDNVRHRGEVHDIKETLRNLEGGIIAADECHVAAGKNMTLAKMLMEAGILNITLLKEKRNRLLEISATPEGVMTDLETWGDNAAMVLLVPGEKYKGFQTMLDEQRIRDAPKIVSEEIAMNMLRFFDNRFTTTTKKYFLVRTDVPNTIANFKAAAIRLKWEFKHHDSKEKIENADAMMSAAPDNHTIIFIKGFWRASKRLIRDNVGGTYEQPPKKRNTTTTSQGLTARFCDTFDYTGSWLNPNLRPIHFCDLGAVEQYMNWIQGGCDYRNSEYNANRMKSKDGRIRAPSSKVHHTNIVDLTPVFDERDDTPVVYSLSPTQETRELAHAWIMPRINWAGEWNTSNSRVINVNTCFEDGSPGNTHIRSRGQSVSIPIEQAFRMSGDFSRFGAGVRCVPVKNGTTIMYIVVYKNEWLI